MGRGAAPGPGPGLPGDRGGHDDGDGRELRLGGDAPDSGRLLRHLRRGSPARAAGCGARAGGELDVCAARGGTALDSGAGRGHAAPDPGG
eukprot:8446796-Heterocapsa_arctica.AAC.1